MVSAPVQPEGSTTMAQGNRAGAVLYQEADRQTRRQYQGEQKETKEFMY